MVGWPSRLLVVVVDSSGYVVEIGDCGGRAAVVDGVVIKCLSPPESLIEQ